MAINLWLHNVTYVAAHVPRELAYSHVDEYICDRKICRVDGSVQQLLCYIVSLICSWHAVLSTDFELTRGGSIAGFHRRMSHLRVRNTKINNKPIFILERSNFG